MKNPRARLRFAEGFTLIELLTVITIIAILMAMLFPFIMGAKESARKQKAGVDVRNIVHAVEQYNVEYGQYPKVNPSATAPAGTPPDDAVGDQAAGMALHNSKLFNTLRDIDKEPNATHSQNPRRVVLMEGKAVNNTASPRDGFLEVAGGTGDVGSMYDPWGMEYNVVLDSNSDNTIDLKDYYEDFKDPTTSPHVTVGSFSLGKDKKLGTAGDKNYKKGADYSDDVVSWTSH